MPNFTQHGRTWTHHRNRASATSRDAALLRTDKPLTEPERWIEPREPIVRRAAAQAIVVEQEAVSFDSFQARWWPADRCFDPVRVG